MLVLEIEERQIVQDAGLLRFLDIFLDCEQGGYFFSLWAEQRTTALRLQNAETAGTLVHIVSLHIALVRQPLGPPGAVDDLGAQLLTAGYGVIALLNGPWIASMIVPLGPAVAVVVWALLAMLVKKAANTVASYSVPPGWHPFAMLPFLFIEKMVPLLIFASAELSQEFWATTIFLMHWDIVRDSPPLKQALRLKSQELRL